LDISNRTFAFCANSTFRFSIVSKSSVVVGTVGLEEGVESFTLFNPVEPPVRPGETTEVIDGLGDIFTPLEIVDKKYCWAARSIGFAVPIFDEKKGKQN